MPDPEIYQKKVAEGDPQKTTGKHPKQQASIQNNRQASDSKTLNTKPKTLNPNSNTVPDP